MKPLPSSTLAALLLCVSGCTTSPRENDHKAFDADVRESCVLLQTLQMLDSGDIQKTRQVAMLPLLVDLSSLPDYAAKTRPSAQQQEALVSMAREALDYLFVHREEFDPRWPSVRMGVRGLQKTLTKPEDARRLAELLEYFAGVEKRKSEGSKP